MQPRNVSLTRLYSTEDGLTHFEDVSSPMLFPVWDGQYISRHLGQGRLFEFEPDFYLDWHNSKKRVYYIYLQGRQEIEVGNGQRRQFGAGDIILAEDLTGKGHRSWSVSEDTGRAIILEIPPESE